MSKRIERAYHLPRLGREDGAVQEDDQLASAHTCTSLRNVCRCRTICE
eukprot:CAMPEP_0119357058 /NCGR_PEP_ID=MMETSP1334-20130426/5516_1 /TAXON_ID=127549 /ORGANISM="Calcidiscus leptoporus, Strain RCC1130" /LENGTH=47 /DNA_ID= /DNA_START= /DNA_END= /DNA_ORIENTATION=